MGLFQSKNSILNRSVAGVVMGCALGSILGSTGFSGTAVGAVDPKRDAGVGREFDAPVFYQQLSDLGELQTQDLKLSLLPIDVDTLSRRQEWLRLMPLPSGGSLEKLGAAPNRPKRFLLRVPLSLDPGVKIGTIESTDRFELRMAPEEVFGLTFVPFVVDNDRACRILKTFFVARPQEVRDYELCVVVEPTAVSRISQFRGPDYHQRIGGLWVQGGTHYVLQDLASLSSAHLGLFHGGAFRLDVGYVWAPWELGVSYRKVFWSKSATAEDSRPRWLQVSAVYGKDYPLVGRYRPYLGWLMGLDSYSNQVEGTDRPKVSAFPAVVAGIRYRRIFVTDDWTTDMWVGWHPGYYKTLLQTDYRHWWTLRWAYGLSAWIDLTWIKEDSRLLGEQVYSIGGYLRYAF